MKRIISTLLLIALLFVICSCASTPTTTTTAAGTTKSTTTVSGQTTSTTTAAKKEVTVELRFPQNSGLRPSMDTTAVWDFIRKETGITFKLTVNKDAAQKDLMFASRDFPDMMANIGATVDQLATAAEAGDLVQLNPLLEKYCPTWMKFLADNPLVYNLAAMTDGKLYTLPYCNHDPADRELRDQWLYIYPWLDELKLSVPKTTAEFKNVLTAIKNAAGTGTIPKNVIPYYYLFDSYVGGQFDIYGSFGVIVTSADYLAVKEDGTVVCQAVNPDIKEPLKYLRELYAAGLTPPECVTDDWNAYLSKISSNPPIVFSYGSYANRLPAMTYPMAPLDSGNGKKPVMRRQAYSTNPTHATAIFKQCKYQVEIANFFEWAMKYENAMTLNFGLKGVVWDVDKDGKMFLNFWESNQAKMNENSKSVGFNNSWFAILPKDLYVNHYSSSSYDVKGTREWGFKNIYQNFLPYEKSVYLGGTLTTDKQTMMSQYATDINALRKKTFADWITGKGDIDKEWDAYVAKMNTLKLKEWLQYKQEAYDLLMKK